MKELIFAGALVAVCWLVFLVLFFWLARGKHDSPRDSRE